MDITRRDFLNGSLLTLGSLTLSPMSLYSSLLEDDYYPPIRGDFRGSHPGSFESMHELAWGGRSDFGKIVEMKEEFDLVVVGAGISGLASAYLYQKKHGKNAKILILDNHDDFGGHAQRNEFIVGKKRIYGYAGSQSMESPFEYDEKVYELLEEIGVDFEGFEESYDFDFYKRHSLKAITHLGKGKNIPFVPNNEIFYEFPGVMSGEMDIKEALEYMAAKDELKRLFDGVKKQINYSDEMPYFEYLKREFGVESREVFELVRYISSGDYGYGADAMSIKEAKDAGLPGFTMFETPRNSEILNELKNSRSKQYIHHYPDGNATIARLFVKALIPDVAEFKSDAMSINARFTYNKLDSSKNSVRIRLNSTVINAQNKDGGASITYLKNGKPHMVNAKACVMACWNMAIAHIVPTLPTHQKEALRALAKAPLVYTNVVLDDWSALKRTGIGYAYSPNRLHATMAVDYPVSMGGYSFARDTNDPIVLHFEYIPLGAEYGKEPREQYKEGRSKLLGMSFSEFESEIKSHLSDMLGGGFNADKNIRAITVNRWSHGYSYSGSALFDPDTKAHKIGRKKFGNIVIANSDAGANAYLDSAIEQAFRAIKEV